jgi:hypothetical protein
MVLYIGLKKGPTWLGPLRRMALRIPALALGVGSAAQEFLVRVRVGIEAVRSSPNQAL